MVASVLTSAENVIERAPTKADMADDQNEEPNFSDPENFVDDIDESELVGDILREKPNEQDIEDTVVVIYGIPRVGNVQKPKLITILRKIFKKCGNILEDYYPEKTDADNPDESLLKGYCFVVYESKAIADDAIIALNGHYLDKTHSFTATSFRNFEKFRQLEDLDNWQPPERRPYKDRGNLRSWLMNPDCLDHFVLHYQNGDKVGIYRNSVTGEPEKVAEKSHWSDSFVRWSPFGTYIATVHKQGVALWGGENFEQINRFMHPGVQHLDFSPAENYVITYAPPRCKSADMPDAVKIWAIRTGELKRTFSSGGNVNKRWPFFRWNYNDTMFATMGKKDMINVYETSTFTLVEKKGLKIDNVCDFQWSPKQSIIAYWLKEVGEAPGGTAIMSFPEKEELRNVNLFNFAEASIHWQKSGDNLCFKVDRYGKKKVEDGEVKYINLSTQLVIIHMQMKDYPSSTIELKETIQALAWEPVGSKLCLIQGDMRSNIVVYGVKSNQPHPSVVHLKTLENRGQVNTIAWSPHGQYLVCAGLKTQASGALMFIDCSQTEITYMNVQEHPGVTDVEWDPTGRYVVSSISTWSTSSSKAMDFGYNMYNFQGRPLARRPVDNLCAFAWRPRPPSLLSEAKIKEIKKNFKRYAAEFDEKDKHKLDKASQEVSEKRRKMVDEYTAWCDENKKAFDDEAAKRAALRREEDADEFEEETIEYLFSQEKITVE